MIELGVIKLTDLLVGLIKYRHSNVLSLLDEIYKTFELVHKDYMDSFRHYRELLNTSKEPLNLNHPIFGAIKDDQLFLAEARLKLIKLSQVHENSQIMSGLINAISGYLYGLEGLRPWEIPNYRRWEVLEKIQAVAATNITEFRNYVKGFKSNERAIKALNPRDPLRALVQSNSTITDKQLSEFKKIKIILMLDRSIIVIQQRYAHVLQEYYELKKRLT